MPKPDHRVPRQHLFERLWQRPETDRLASAVVEARRELDRWRAEAFTPDQPSLAQTLDAGARQRRVQAAEVSPTQAEEYLDRGKLQPGWDALQSAQRELLACDLCKARRETGFFMLGSVFLAVTGKSF